MYKSNFFGSSAFVDIVIAKEHSDRLRQKQLLYLCSRINYPVMKTFKFILSLFFALSLFSACKKDSKKGGISPTSVYYFIGKINDTAVNWEATTTPDGWGVGSSAALTNNLGEISGGITALFADFPAELPQLGIEFKTFDKKPNDDSETVLKSFVTTGSWTFSNNKTYTIGDKSTVVYYTDNNGKQYNSIGSQTGSSMTVISVVAVSADAYNSDPGINIKLNLTCTLYPVTGVGDPIKITNGQATVFLDDML
jgi:hypothetical protein